MGREEVAQRYLLLLRATASDSFKLTLLHDKGKVFRLTDALC